MAHRERRERDRVKEGIYDLEGPGNEQDDWTDGPEDHCQDNDQARTPEGTFQPSLDKALLVRGFDPFVFTLAVSVLVFHQEEMDAEK